MLCSSGRKVAGSAQRRPTSRFAKAPRHRDRAHAPGCLGAPLIEDARHSPWGARSSVVVVELSVPC